MSRVGAVGTLLRPAGSAAGGDPETTEEAHVSGEDKASNKFEEAKGKGKETLGDAKGDEEMRDEGKGDQSKSKLKQAGEKVKDAFR